VDIAVRRRDVDVLDNDVRVGGGKRVHSIQDTQAQRAVLTIARERDGEVQGEEEVVLLAGHSVVGV
jgi:hypothetical protein